MSCALLQSHSQQLIQCAELSPIGCRACAQNLLEAVSRGDAKKARQLLDWRADVDQRDKAQRSALHLAAAQGEEALTRLLLAFHADVDALDATQRTPLHWAQQQGHAPVAGALLQNWAKPLTDRPPKTPARRGEVPQAETVAESGVPGAKVLALIAVWRVKNDRSRGFGPFFLKNLKSVLKWWALLFHAGRTH
ncbi:unnamed protein product [Effrenium voratum]|nr:unnamed protein product [Effrenium voratum]